MACAAAIDIGTHSALLLIAALTDSQVTPIVDVARTTHLGEGLSTTGEISAAALARLLAVLESYQVMLSEYSPEPVVVFGTAALRHAQNGEDIAQQIRARFGWPIRILSGEAEANYTFQGVMQGLQQETRRTNGQGNPGAIAIDIGGGSTEVIVGDQQAVRQQWSFPIGAVIAKETYAPGECISEPEAEQLDLALGDIFQSIVPPLVSLPVLFTGGTATTLAALVLELGIYDIDKIDGCGLTVDQLTMVYDELNQLSLSQRADLPGMEAGRAGVILPAMRILLKLLHQLKATSVTVTVRGARYGILTALKD